MKKEEKLLYLDTPKGRIACSVVRTRRRTYAAVVLPTGEVQIRIPMRGSLKRAGEIAEDWKDWILQKVEAQRSRREEKEELLNRRNERFTPEQRKELEKTYRAAAKDYIPQRAAYYAGILGVKFERVRIAEQKTRWGSCSAKGTLSFNWKLMLAPPKVLDYVIIHEVCHLKEMNHSRAFWAWVGFLMPDYGEQRKWLKQHGEELQYY